VKKTIVGVVLGVATVAALYRFAPGLKARAMAKCHAMMAKCREMLSAAEGAKRSSQPLSA
jgi:hypothetical protein